MFQKKIDYVYDPYTDEVGVYLNGELVMSGDWISPLDLMDALRIEYTAHEIKNVFAWPQELSRFGDFLSG